MARVDRKSQPLGRCTVVAGLRYCTAAPLYILILIKRTRSLNVFTCVCIDRIMRLPWVSAMPPRIFTDLDDGGIRSCFNGFYSWLWLFWQILPAINKPLIVSMNFVILSHQFHKWYLPLFPTGCGHIIRIYADEVFISNIAVTWDINKRIRDRRSY